ncbi:MAG: ornithine carbamoyltransferase [Desulfatibacillaceae bacterium]|nr:ornithine carbamoyltransferase [Desulfatibacillaceae bacterium]
MKKDITTLWDLNKQEIDHLLDSSISLKNAHKQGADRHPLVGKSVGLVFDKPSTRTRVSFEAAMIQLGGVPMYINVGDTQLIRNEPVSDTARVLSRYLDGLVVRTYSQQLLEDMAQWAEIPVINALTDLYHPCQILSDIMTVVEQKGGYKGIRIAWIGDGNNVAHSWINAAAILGLDLVLACPPGHQPNRQIMQKALDKSIGSISLAKTPQEAARGADVLYTDVWASMGQETESALRKTAFEGFAVDEKLVALAAPNAIVMHCLPAHRGEEISNGVMEGPQSVVWDQAENKLHMHKAVLEALLKTWR